MKNHNPLAKTYYEFTKNRIQHYSTTQHTCASCNHAYYPKVHSQTYLVQFGSIIAGLAIFFAFLVFAPKAMPIIIAAIVGYLIYYKTKKRNISDSATPNSVKYGEIVLECPQCGNNK